MSDCEWRSHAPEAVTDPEYFVYFLIRMVTRCSLQNTLGQNNQFIAMYPCKVRDSITHPDLIRRTLLSAQDLTRLALSMFESEFARRVSDPSGARGQVQERGT